MPADSLNPKQKRFVDEYLIDLNATQAAKRAGYSEKTAHSTGPRLLEHVGICAAIAAGQAKHSRKLEITAERVIKELALIGFANMKDYLRVTDQGDAFLDLSDLTHDQAAAISEITSEDFIAGRGDDARDVRRTKLKLLDKRAALIDLGKYLGLFTEKSEVAVTVTDNTSAAEKARTIAAALAAAANGVDETDPRRIH